MHLEFQYQAGKVSNPVSLIDIYPSLIDLTGLPEHPNVNGNGYALDGFSFRPFLEDPQNGEWNGPPVALNHLHGVEAPPDNTPSPIEDNHHSVRSERYRYTLTSNGEEELYDHLNDPHEWNNLASQSDDEQIQSVLDWHHTELLKLIDAEALNTGTELSFVKLTNYKTYPNPFNESTKIDFELPSHTKVKLEVFNVYGEVITELVNGVLPKGKQSINFNATGLSSGAYFCKITTPQNIQIRKMMHIN
jgi:hypothetical protein